MNTISTTIPLQYITIGDITYLLTPVKTLEHLEVVKDFSDFLDGLDPEIFNRSNEEYGNRYNLNTFSELFKSTYLNSDSLNSLKQCILEYKKIVKEVIEDRINYLYSKLNKDNISFTEMLESTMDSVENCIKYAEENNLTNIQEFLDWEDDLNVLSVKDHNC